MQKSIVYGFTALLVAAGLVGAGADPVTIVASDSAQVGTKGPSGSSTFLDVEGSGNTSRFESFGVLEFNQPFSGFTATSIDPTITLSLVDSPFSQTRPGVLDFYLVTDNATSLASGSSLVYQPSATTAPEGLGAQLGTQYFLGSGAYTSTTGSPNGTDAQIYNYNLTLSPAAQSYFLSQFLDPNGVLRVAITPDTSGTNPKNEVASFAGATNGLFNGNAPTLSFNAVPEPGSVATLMVGTGSFGLLALRRRKRT